MMLIIMIIITIVLILCLIKIDYYVDDGSIRAFLKKRDG